MAEKVCINCSYRKKEFSEDGSSYCNKTKLFIRNIHKCSCQYFSTLDLLRNVFRRLNKPEAGNESK